MFIDTIWYAQTDSGKDNFPINILKDDYNYFMLHGEPQSGTVSLNELKKDKPKPLLPEKWNESTCCKYAIELLNAGLVDSDVGAVANLAKHIKDDGANLQMATIEKYIRKFVNEWKSKKPTI